jgi:hypothetical protein
MLLEKTGTNLASICKMRIIATTEVNPLPLEFNGQLIGEVTLPAGKNWQDLYFTKDSAHFAEKGDGEMVIKFRVPRDSPENQATVLMLESKEWIVEITDHNGYKKIAGRENEPCVIQRELRDHGQNRRDSNHYNMVILLSRSEPVPFAHS